MYNDDQHIIKLSNNSTSNKSLAMSESKNVSYNAQGELIVDNKCSVYNDNHENNSQYWDIEQNDDDDDTVSNKSSKYDGKTMVLVDSNEPWYLNKDTTIPMKYYSGLELTDKQYRSDSDFGSNENTEFEHFNSNNSNNSMQTQILMLLLTIVIMLVLYRRFMN